MAIHDSTRSSFFMQRAGSSSKLRIYEALCALNQSVDQVAAALRNLKTFPFARKDSLQCAQDEIEEVRASVNAALIEELGERERVDEGRFWKRRRVYEKKLEDPDDIYIHLASREKERTKIGLPPRIGVIPYSAVSEETKRNESAHKHEKSRKKRKQG